MIARVWRGWAPASTAEAYRLHYESEVATQLRTVDGFLGARLLRQHQGEEVLYTSITYFTGLDAVRAFAGADHTRAVLADEARRVLSHWDDQVTHHEVVTDL
jgi:heme-degrading monooxygenase HmoA